MLSAVSHPQHFESAADLRSPIHDEHDDHGDRHAGSDFFPCWHVCPFQEKPIQRPQAATVNHTSVEATATVFSTHGVMVE